MEFQSADTWNENLWRQAEPIYKQAFPQGSKTPAIIRRILDKQMGSLHVGYLHGEAAAMAVTGIVPGSDVLILDYLAVREELRGQGIGRTFLDYLKNWSLYERRLNSIVIEVESEPSPENERRIRFWESCGFILTDYVHHYIWVPEPYQAMYLNLQRTASVPKDGQAWFRYITNFHKRAYRG